MWSKETELLYKRMKQHRDENQSMHRGLASIIKTRVNRGRQLRKERPAFRACLSVIERQARTRLRAAPPASIRSR
jgi:hypothetical protein